MNKEVGYTPFYKYMLIIASSIMIIITVITSISNILGGNYYDPIVIGFPVLLIVSYLFITAIRRRIVITDRNIKKRNFLEKEIDYNEVSKITVLENQMRVTNDDVTIPITKDIEDHEEIIKFLVKKLAPLHNVEIQGDKKFVERVLSES